MLEEKEVVSVADKVVSTSDDPLFNYAGGGNECFEEPYSWSVLKIDNLIKTLVDNKLISIRELEAQEVFDLYASDSSISLSPEKKHKKPPDKKLRHPEVSRQCSSCSQKHSRIDERRNQGHSFSKVQKWSDDIHVETSFYSRSDEDISVESKAPPRKKNAVRTCKSPMVSSSHSGTKKKRRKRRKTIKKKPSQIDPEDLPKRARWTIIITSGLLILTCMFLVGITLRMAPVIDQMVRTKNEELMNSLNRDDNSDPAYYSAEMWDTSPIERAKKKYSHNNKK